MNGKKTAVTLAIGSAFAVSLSAIPAAHADNTPFGMQALKSGYMVADAKAPDGKCGGKKAEEMKAKEGKCGGKKDAMPEATKAKDGKCGGKTADEMKAKEGKCGGKK